MYTYTCIYIYVYSYTVVYTYNYIYNVGPPDVCTCTCMYSTLGNQIFPLTYARIGLTHTYIFYNFWLSGMLP